MFGHVISCNRNQRGPVEHLEDTVFPAGRLAREQTFERLVRVHQRHAERLGKMLLREGKTGMRVDNMHAEQFSDAPVVEKPYETTALLEAVRRAIDRNSNR